MSAVIIYNAKIATMDPALPQATAVVIENGRFTYVGSDADAKRRASSSTVVIDAHGRRAIPGLNDSHTHVIRGGLSYNMEVRWEGVATLADALRMLHEAAVRTPPGQWIRVVGGWTEQQFEEKRGPTLDELNAVSPTTPVFVLHLYHCAMLNQTALRYVGYTRDTQSPPGGEIVRDSSGEPTGLLVAVPSAVLLYRTLDMGPRLGKEDQKNSTRVFMRELNRLGVTSIIDAGGGSQRYPQDYEVIMELWRERGLTLRIAYNIFTQNPKKELADFEGWTRELRVGQGDAMFRHNGAGEMLVYSAADFENFLHERAKTGDTMKEDLERVVSHLVEKRWPFRLHATYEETILQALDVFERVNAKTPFNGLRWWIDHAETVSDASIDRIKHLGGGIAIQSRMYFQGEYFLERYGKEVTARAPPIRRILEKGVPLGAGTDATRVASYNPWTTLHWLVSGKTIGGTTIYPDSNRLTREEALRIMTVGSAWFSGEEREKGMVKVGMLADLVLLSRDYFDVSEDEIPRLESVLTVVDGEVVHAAGEHEAHAPSWPRATPTWTPAANASAPAPASVRAALEAPTVPLHATMPILATAPHDHWHDECDC